MTFTVGKVLLKKFLPQAFHDYVDSTIMDKKGITKLFADLAEKHPDKYADVVSHMARLGFEVSTRNGSSVSLQDLVSPIDKDKEYDKLDKRIKEIDDKKLPKAKRDEELFDLYSDFTAKIDKDILTEGVKQNRTLAKIVVAGSRGSPAQYRATVATQGIVSDEKQKPLLDFPVRNSFAEGLTLPEYLAHSYGARQGETAKKLSTADSGYLSKQLSRAAMTTKIEEHDCGTDNGLTVEVSDKDSIGCFLAHPAGSYKKNNEVTSKMLNDLSNKGVKQIVVRSPITCEASKKYHFGAVCQLCAGRREKGLPEIGSYLGVIAASSLGEPLAQSQMNLRHSGSAAAKNTFSGGFKRIDQLMNIPKAFKDKAAMASEDGVITAIKPSAAGGTFIYVNNKEHYVPVDFASHVKVGDKVEAGDVLSEGVVNPAEVVHYKGIGEGRKYFTETMKKVFDQSGMPVNRRNFELIAKSAIDHVKVTDPEGLGDYLPDQIVSYNTIEKGYKARKDSSLVRTDHALGMYLEQPVLHYTIGTRITSKVITELRNKGIQSVTVNKNPPQFEPVMSRLLAVPSHVPDWAHNLYATYLERGLVDAVNKGISNTSSLKGPSPIMGLAYSLGFGKP
jgi:DNA-directed RNA polymerase subunit beta'